MAFISKKIENLLNFRIVEEEKSARLYKAMAEWLKFKGYSGAGALWSKYSDEEFSHAHKVYTYLQNLDLLPCTPALVQPQEKFDGLINICQMSYQHELDITQQCNDLCKAGHAEGDYMTVELAQWFLKEQNEEINKVTYWLNRIDVLGGAKISPEALFLLDGEMQSVANN